MAGRLEGRTALVTGAGRGHGRGIALTMAREGARVVVNDVGTSAFGDGTDTRPADEVTREILSEGGEAIADFGDITDPRAAQDAVNVAIDRWGKLDILVNVAGTIRLCTITDISRDDWESQLRVHLTGYFNTTHHAAKHWVERSEYGRLINFTSASAWLAQPSLLSYSTAKAGVIGFTRACANGLAAHGVTCNAIAPSAQTPMADAAIGPQVPSSLETVGTDRDPIHGAPLVVYLASPAAAHVSGRVFSTAGGRYTLWSEPADEREVEVNFLAAPDALYDEFELTLTAGLRLEDLSYPAAPLDRLGSEWRAGGLRIPRWDFS